MKNAESTAYTEAPILRKVKLTHPKYSMSDDKQEMPSINIGKSPLGQLIENELATRNSTMSPAREAMRRTHQKFLRSNGSNNLSD